MAIQQFECRYRDQERMQLLERVDAWLQERRAAAQEETTPFTPIVLSEILNCGHDYQITVFY